MPFIISEKILLSKYLLFSVWGGKWSIRLRWLIGMPFRLYKEGDKERLTNLFSHIWLLVIFHWNLKPREISCTLSFMWNLLYVTFNMDSISNGNQSSYETVSLYIKWAWNFHLKAPTNINVLCLCRLMPSQICSLTISYILNRLNYLILYL